MVWCFDETEIIDFKLNYNKKTRYSVFENQLCNYLNATRGLHIKPENVISTRSTEMSLYIISQLLIRQKDVVLVGDLAPIMTPIWFSNKRGAIIKTIPVDEQGLDVDYIKNHFAKGNIRCVYLYNESQLSDYCFIKRRTSFKTSCSLRKNTSLP